MVFAVMLPPSLKEFLTWCKALRFLTNHSKQGSDKRSNIKNGTRRQPQHPQPRHSGTNALHKTGASSEA